MILLCIRHGETNYNQLGLCNDDPRDRVHLTDRGIRQIETVAEQLRPYPLDRIITSRLPRTRQSANIINQYQRTTILNDPLLNDIRSGFNGLPVSDYFAAIANDPIRFRPKGGESLIDHRQRIEQFLHRLRSDPCNRCLVIAHEETLRAFTVILNNEADERLRSYDFRNGEIIRFDL